MKRLLAALLIALWSVPALGQLGPGGSNLGPSGGGSGGSVPAGSIAVGVTAITGGTTTRVIYDNGGLVGEYTNTQLTALINPATSSLSGALPAFPGNTTTFFRGDGAYTALNLAAFPTQVTNTVLGNATSGTAVPTALAVGTCSTASSALIWTTNTGFGCNTSITASAVAVGGITGLGTGVATALGINVGSAGAPVTFNGALGTPSSGVATNLTGTAASLTAGTVTTNANLTGEVTSVGNATTIAASARLKSKRVTIIRDLTVASGDVAYTGFGFQPTSCLATGMVASGNTLQYISFNAHVDSASGSGVSYAGGGVYNISASFFLVFIDTTGSNSNNAVFKQFDADGFTLTWTKTGTPTGSAATSVICYR